MYTLDQVVENYREQQGKTLEQVSEALKNNGVEITPQGLWKRGKRKAAPTEYGVNPKTIRALADLFDTTPLHMLEELGFDVIPKGFTADDIMIARTIASVPDEMKDDLLDALNAILILTIKMSKAKG